MNSSAMVEVCLSLMSSQKWELLKREVISKQAWRESGVFHLVVLWFHPFVVSKMAGLGDSKVWEGECWQWDRNPLLQAISPLPPPVCVCRSLCLCLSLPPFPLPPLPPALLVLIWC